MAVEIVTREDLQEFRTQLLDDLQELFKKIQVGQPEKTWLRSNDVKKMLGISDGTLFNYRVAGKIRSSKIGNLHFYQREDVERMMKANLNHG